MKLFLLAICILGLGNPPSDNQNKLSLKVTSEAASKGKYYIKLTHLESDEKKEILRVVDVNAPNQFITFSTLPKGSYTLAIFHDVNGNGKLDKNYLGVPTEPYGFSNNARGLFGPPSQKAQTFRIEKETLHELYLE